MHWLQIACTLYKVSKAHQFGWFIKAHTCLGVYKRYILGEVTNLLLPKESWLKHLVTFLCKSPVIKAIRVTYFIKIVQILSLSSTFGVSNPSHISRLGYTPDTDLAPDVDHLLPQKYHPFKGIRSDNNVLWSCPLDDSLVSFMIIMITNSLCPPMISNPYLRCMRILHILPWSITFL